ncbi:MAG: ABC transporter permease, partial [Planctomycetota bacterium]
MAVPLLYNLRHLRARPLAAALTALGIALPTMALLFALALPEGLKRVLQGSGEPGNLVVLRKGALTETNSAIARDTASLLETLPEIAKDEGGRPLASPEAVIVVFKPRRNGLKSNLIVRATGEVGRGLRPRVGLVEGRWHRPGLPELTVSRKIADRYENLGLGESIRFSRNDWRVVGIFEAGGTASESEAWGDRDLLMEEFRRDLYSSVLVSVPTPEKQATFVQELRDNPRLSLAADPEQEYYGKQTKDIGIPVQFVGVFASILLAIGATVGAANTMYAAVSHRTQEIAVLRAIGFRRRGILLSFLLESFAVALLGGLVGCVLAYLFFNGRATSTVNWWSFSDVAFQFRITPRLLGIGAAFAALIGIVGGALPARLAASRS